MGNIAHRIADLLLEMEAELRRLDLWETEAPPLASLSSQEPFCIDTLALEQWLQWVFLPRMRYILEQNHALPLQSDIFPYAEECLMNSDYNGAHLLALIKRFDELIAQQGHT